MSDYKFMKELEKLNKSQLIIAVLSMVQDKILVKEDVIQYLSDDVNKDTIKEEPRSEWIVNPVEMGN